MATVRRVLAVSRATKHCRKALQFASSMAEAYGAELYIMHVIHSPFRFRWSSAPRIFFPAMEEGYRQMIRQTEENLDRLTGNVKVVEGEPREKIFQLIEEKRIDVLVISVYEKWRLEHFLFGKEIEEILRRMPCSVFLVEPHKIIDELG